MSAPLTNDTFLCVLRRQPTDHTPPWPMRQAGRYLPEYNTTCAWAGSFLGLAKSSAYATEMTLQPLDRYPSDAAILSSDIPTMSDAMDLGLSFAQGEGPRFVKPVRTEAGVAALSVPDMSSLQYVLNAVAEICRALAQDSRQRVLLIGFSGSPWVLTCHIVEGGGSDDFRTVKPMLYVRPSLTYRILEINTQVVIDYLNAQIDAGAQAVQVFDIWSGALADGIYQQFSLIYMTHVVNGIRAGADGQRVSVILSTKGGGLWLEAMAEAGADTLGMDWTVNLQLARQRTAGRVALQNNLDPAVLLVELEAIRAQVRCVLEDHIVRGGSDGHIFNLDHGTSQFTLPEAVSVLVDEVYSFSRALRTKAKSHG